MMSRVSADKVLRASYLHVKDYSRNKFSGFLRVHFAISSGRQRIGDEGRTQNA